MSDGNPRSFGFGSAVALGVGAVVGLFGGCLGCMMLVTISDRLRVPPPAWVAIGVVMAVLPLVTLLSKRRPGGPFAVGLLIGICLAGLLLGACGTLMMS